MNFDVIFKFIIAKLFQKKNVYNLYPPKLLIYFINSYLENIFKKIISTFITI